MGQCPACKEWNTFVEETVDKKSISSSGKVKKESKAAQVLPLSAVKSEKEERIVTGNGALLYSTLVYNNSCTINWDKKGVFILKSNQGICKLLIQ